MKEWITRNKKSLLGENQAEPKAVEAEVRRAASTAPRATEKGKIAKATTTEHASGSTISTCRIYL